MQRREGAGPEWVVVGKLGKTFGLRGEIVVHRFAEAPGLFAAGAQLKLVGRNESRLVHVVASRQMGKKFVARFEGLERVEEIQPWVGSTVEIASADLPDLEDDSFYHFELIGLEVYAADGRRLGTLEEILETGGNDIYCVRDGEHEVLVPAIRDAIAGIDLAAGRMDLKDLKGMIGP